MRPGYANAFTEYRQGLETVHAPSAEVVRTADEAPKVGPRTVRNGLIALCLGLVLALIIVFLADALDTRVRSVDSIREALGLPLLGRLPTPPSRQRKGNGLVMLADPTSHEAEPYRVLRASLEFANADHSFRTIMITSAVDAEGKSTTIANLAVTLARAGRRVILIDADLSSPHLHRLFDLDERPGLTDLDLGDTRLEEALRPIGLKGEASEADHVSRRMDRTGSLEVLPGGSTLQDKLGFENAVGRIIHRVRDRADIVLVDAPPLLMGDAIALSAHVDAVVVVARLKALRMSTLEDMSRILDASPATKLGFIVTGVDQSNPYRQHQRYAASERRAEEKPRLTLTVASLLRRRRWWSAGRREIGRDRKRDRDRGRRRPAGAQHARPLTLEARRQAVRGSHPERSGEAELGDPQSEVGAARRCPGVGAARREAGRAQGQLGKRAGIRHASVKNSSAAPTTSLASAKLDVAAGEGAFRR